MAGAGGWLFGPPGPPHLPTPPPTHSHTHAHPTPPLLPLQCSAGLSDGALDPLLLHLLAAALDVGAAATGAAAAAAAAAAVSAPAAAVASATVTSAAVAAAAAAASSAAATVTAAAPAAAPALLAWFSPAQHASEARAVASLPALDLSSLLVMALDLSSLLGLHHTRAPTPIPTPCVAARPSPGCRYPRDRTAALVAQHQLDEAVAPDQVCVERVGVGVGG